MGHQNDRKPLLVSYAPNKPFAPYERQFNITAIVEQLAGTTDASMSRKDGISLS